MKKFTCPVCQQKINISWLYLASMNKIFICKTCNNKLVFNGKARFTDISSLLLTICVVSIVASKKLPFEKDIFLKGLLLGIFAFVCYMVFYKLISCLLPDSLSKLDTDDK